MGKPKKSKSLFLLAHNTFLAGKNKLFRNIQKVALLAGIVFSCLPIFIGLINYYLLSKNGQKVLGVHFSQIQSATSKVYSSPVIEITTIPPSPSITPTLSPTPIPTQAPTNTPPPDAQNTPTPNAINPSQYTAQRLNDTTFRVDDVPNDDRMATADEIINALNSYRSQHSRASLIVDPFLSSYALERANLFSSNNGLDSHQGFRSFMDNNGFEKAGFNSLGENSAFVSGPMKSEKIIKNIFGADPLHDSNQLDSWTHVGIGVSGNAINVNFGKNKR